METYLYEDLNDLEDSHWWHIAKRESVIQLIKKYSNHKKSVILDIGCGTGRNLVEFAKFGKSFGIDSSSKAIKFCEKKGLKNVKLGTSSKTGMKNGSFDFVTMLDVLEHVDEGKTLREISRILKSDGKLIITVPAFSWLWSKWDEVLHHKRRYTKRGLAKVLNKNGFKVQKISYMYSFLVLPVLIIRFIKSLVSKEEYSSDFKLSSPLLNKVFLGVSKFERSIWMNFSIPIGTSLICVCKKVQN